MIDPVEIALEYVDWRDFFPHLRWIPQRNFERKIEKMYSRRLAVMKALIKEQSERAASGEESLYEEIQSICGSDKITEENLCRLPLLDAVFHETLRTHIPLPIVPLRYVHEDTELGGYYVPAGSEIAINLYGCNMDENRWEKPEEWNPERFLDDKKKYAPSDLYKTMAFGAGKRLCPGALQATLIVCTTIGRLVQEFEWRLEDGEEEDVDIVGIINQKLHPMHAVIRPRNL
ncbi:hypothetical protein RHGRI_021923 [Rhododendron griersonianum]|uniref:Cytochrome P450 n=1 Tax=Rhododendron griersonianum TaxID=479676 RepID=A0AAV6JM64_9ERIC|nr:hypothetical protein RHGRI_021923 [Rhododendron griersonianum]